MALTQNPQAQHNLGGCGLAGPQREVGAGQAGHVARAVVGEYVELRVRAEDLRMQALQRLAAADARGGLYRQQDDQGQEDEERGHVAEELHHRVLQHLGRLRWAK